MTSGAGSFCPFQSPNKTLNGIDYYSELFDRILGLPIAANGVGPQFWESPKLTRAWARLPRGGRARRSEELGRQLRA